LVFTPKYRRAVITERVFFVLRTAWDQVCQDFGCELRETGRYPPKVALARLVNALKGVSARRLRAADLLEVRKKLWGEHFWSPSYCAVSCGGAPLDVVKAYVKKQRGGASSPP
jgi:putative transposase